MTKLIAKIDFHDGGIQVVTKGKEYSIVDFNIFGLPVIVDDINQERGWSTETKLNMIFYITARLNEDYDRAMEII